MSAAIVGPELDALRAVIEPLDTETARNAYRRGDFPRADRVKDLNKRYRWDIFYAAQAWRVVTDGRTDAHIDTALRAIVGAL